MASNLCSQKHFPFRKLIRVGEFHELTASTDICPFILHLFDLALVSRTPFLRRCFCPPLLVGFPEGNQIRNFPEPIRDASGHSWGHAKCTVNLDEVVGEIIKGNCRRMIFQLASIFAPALIEWA
jgi:hypothetical protein